MLFIILALLFRARIAGCWPLLGYLATEWHWQSSLVVGNWLYIEGGDFYQIQNGQVWGFGLGQTISVDLSQSWTNNSVSNFCFQTQRPTLMPTVARPSLWYDPKSNKVYEWGGWFYGGNDTSVIWTFTPISNGSVAWTESPGPTGNGLVQNRSIFSPASAASDTNFYSLGGNLAEISTNPYIAVQGLVDYTFGTNTWVNTSSTSATESGFLVLGGASYAPSFGKRGFLIFLGGVIPSTQVFILNGTQQANMSAITLYDINTGKWYHQTATGTIPPPRKSFCLVAGTSAEGSFEIFVLGGSTNNTYDWSNGDNDGYRNVFALSIPAFKWFQSSDSSQMRRAEHNCQVIGPGKSQMLVIGGVFPSEIDGNSVEDPWLNGIGVFDMISFNWSDLYNATASPYQQPDVVKQYYTSSYEAPAWNDPFLAGIFEFNPPSTSTSSLGPTSNPSSASDLSSTTGASSTFNPSSTSLLGSTAQPSSAATPNPTQTSSPSSKANHTSAIVGGVIGGVGGLILVLGVSYFLLYIKRRSKQAAKAQTPEMQRQLPRPGSYEIDGNVRVELPVTPPELPAPQAWPHPGVRP